MLHMRRYISQIQCLFFWPGVKTLWQHKVRTEKWTKKSNSINCLPNACYNVFYLNYLPDDPFQMGQCVSNWVVFITGPRAHLVLGQWMLPAYDRIKDSRGWLRQEGWWSGNKSVAFKMYPTWRILNTTSFQSVSYVMLITRFTSVRKKER